MPPTRALSTPCRYGYNCTRPDCFYAHPKDMNKGRPKDERLLCTFGSGCFRKVCHNDHPNGRIMDQLRASIDYCSSWMLVRPHELVRVSAAFQAAFPAPNDGKDRCDFVAAVPVRVAYNDWKRYRGISATGTPDGVPSNPQQIQLYPRTRKGERLLQDAQNRVGMRWSPTPYRPWKTLERMATHDQHWENNQDHYLLCAGYEAFPPGSGVYIELSVTDMMKVEDAGDGQRAGARVAREVLGLPGANGQKWFVFHVSRPDEAHEEAFNITIRAIVDTSKMPAVPRRPEPSRAPQLAQPPVLPPPPPPPPPPSAVRPGAVPAPPARFNAHQQQQQQQQQQRGRGQPFAAPANFAGPSPPPSSPSTSYAFSNATSSASNSPAEGQKQLPGAVSFNRGGPATKAASAAVPAPPPPPQASSLPGGGGGGGGYVQRQQQQQQPQPQPQQQQPPENTVDELSDLLSSLNMAKFRSAFDRQNVDLTALKMMTAESELSGIAIPLGPRIKLMKELGIARGR
ncbi:unnamed protein product [Ectocarpus sp. 8 AP-2014]